MIDSETDREREREIERERERERGRRMKIDRPELKKELQRLGIYFYFRPTLTLFPDAIHKSIEPNLVLKSLYMLQSFEYNIIGVL